MCQLFVYIMIAVIASCLLFLLSLLLSDFWKKLKNMESYFFLWFNEATWEAKREFTYKLNWEMIKEQFNVLSGVFNSKKEHN